jgi:hypothetical protein
VASARVSNPWDSDVRLLSEFAFTVPRPWWGPAEPLASIGLLLRDFPPYPDTPPQAHPMLSCGVDGIHWSAMTADSSSGYVVVMTVPPSLGVNLVLGESLNEFLSLGCRSHFACLAGLVEDISAELKSESDSEEVADVMAALRGRFSLSPWPNVTARLTELEARYGRPEGRVPRDREAEDELVRRGEELVERMKRSFGDP